MANTYTWKVTNLKVKNEDSNKDSVVQVQWQKIGTDNNGNIGTFNGSTPFSSLNIPEGQSFVPFKKLTEETILGWKTNSQSIYSKHMQFKENAKTVTSVYYSVKNRIRVQ